MTWGTGTGSGRPRPWTCTSPRYGVASPSRPGPWTHPRGCPGSRRSAATATGSNQPRCPRASATDGLRRDDFDRQTVVVQSVQQVLVKPLGKAVVGHADQDLVDRL